MEYLCYAFPAAAAGLLVARAQKKQPTSSSSVTLRIINVTDVYMLDNFPCVIVDCIFLFFQRNVCVLLTQVLFPSLLPSLLFSFLFSSLFSSLFSPLFSPLSPPLIPTDSADPSKR